MNIDKTEKAPISENLLNLSLATNDGEVIENFKMFAKGLDSLFMEFYNSVSKEAGYNVMIADVSDFKRLSDEGFDYDINRFIKIHYGLDFVGLRSNDFIRGIPLK